MNTSVLCLLSATGVAVLGFALQIIGVHFYDFRANCFRVRWWRRHSGVGDYYTK